MAVGSWLPGSSMFGVSTYHGFLERGAMTHTPAYPGQHGHVDACAAQALLAEAQVNGRFLQVWLNQMLVPKMLKASARSNVRDK